MAHRLPATAVTLGLAVAAALVPAPVRAVRLGELQVTSTLGQPLDARIPVEAGRGERLHSSCFFVIPDAALREARVAMTLERSARGTALRVRSAEPVQLPAASLRIAVACPDAPPGPRREYAVLVDPPTLARRPATAPAIGATLEARGETLADVARTMFPGDAQARRRYLDALVAANPGLDAESAPPRGQRLGLPDLRTFSASPASAAPAAAPERKPADAAPAKKLAAAAPRTPVEPPAPRTLREPKPDAPAPAPVAPAAPKAPAVASSKDAGAGGRFVLKLSSAEVDLSRSRGMDDRRRAQLRERLLLLEQDDQVSALLAMRHNLRQLESRVNELQLKLAAAPLAVPARPAQAPAAPAPQPAPPVASVVPQEATAPKAPAPVAPPPAAPAPAPAPAATHPTATPSPPSKPPATPTASPKPAAVLPAKPASKAAPPAADTWTLAREYGPWALLALLVLGLAAVATRRRRRDDPDEIEPEGLDRVGTLDHVETSGPAPRGERYPGTIGEIAAPVAAPTTDATRAVVSSDSQLATRLDDADTGELRRRYIEQRFPEVASGAVMLDDTDTVIKGARLFYEDGEIPRAVELLELALEARPEETRLWLALFEIYRLERLAGPFADLAMRFRASHGDSDEWHKVQRVGREIDPGNALYRLEPVDGLETIGPVEARRIAAANAPFDPIAENWLNAPMDFENEALAMELRRALMDQAGITEADLVPNPAPALRNVEMFTVA